MDLSQIMQESGGGRGGVGSLGAACLIAAHSGLAEPPGSREEGGRCPGLRPAAGSGTLGMRWKSAACLQARPQRGGDLQAAAGLAGAPGVLQAGGKRELRVWLKARGSKG